MEPWEQELIDKVDALARGPFSEGAARHDLDGSFSNANMDELAKLGIPGMALPKLIGGMEIGAEAQMRVIEAIAYGDASTAVALNMHLLVADFVGMFPMFPRKDIMLKDIAANGALVCAPGSVPTGELDSRPTGFSGAEDGDELVINGRAGFASGADGAKYVLVGGTIDRGEEKEADLMVSLPTIGTDGLTVRGNWDAMGLRGTASHDVVCEDMRIPRAEAMVVPAELARMAQQALAANPLAGQSRARGALGILAIWLGLSQAAFDGTLAYVKERHGYLATQSSALGTPPGYRSDEAWAQMGIGDMEHWLETGRTILYDSVRRLETPFPSTEEFTRHIVRTVYHLRRMNEEVSAGAMRVCGAHAYVRGRDLERIFRDMVGGNVMAWKTDQLRLTLGQGALGMPITFVGPAGT
jgi:alkylation response protein AidB-like acyl-CoA dehydrogenase